VTRAPSVLLGIQQPATDVLAIPRSSAELDSLRDPIVCTVRYSHLEKEPGLLVYQNRGVLDDQLVAALLGCDLEHLRAVRSALSSLLDLACNELFADEGFEQSVRSLPFRPGDVVVAVGDSITADAMSWAEMLATALRRAGSTGTEVINAGVSSYTTSDLIANFDSIVSRDPSYVIAMIGTNDARRHGARANARLTSPGETHRHLRLYGALVRGLGRARLILLTPPPIDEQRVRRHATFVERHVNWRSNEVVQVADIVRRQQCSVVDVHRAFVGPDLGSYLAADGVHPSVAGQQRILQVLVSALSDEGWKLAV
jgi:lysophospholipase L1-like esterase